MVIGPVLERSGGYGFDTWTAAKGVSSGFAYHCIEHAYYDRRLTLAAVRGAPALTVAVCETSAEFEQAVDQMRLAEGAPRRRACMDVSHPGGSVYH
jgi:hypothetical protein